MLKFGNLYVNKGKWEDNQLISKSWIEKSTSKISTLGAEVEPGIITK